MTDNELADQITDGLGKSIQRFYITNPKTSRDIMDFGMAEYLSGISQSMEFLAKKDGEVTINQFLRSIQLAAKSAGLHIKS